MMPSFYKIRSEYFRQLGTPPAPFKKRKFSIF